MTRNEIIQKNISLTFDFIRYIIQNSEMLDKVPHDAEVEFIEHDLPIRVSVNHPGKSTKSALFIVEHSFKEIAGESRT